MGCHLLLQEIFLTLGLNPGLLLGRQTLYRLSYQGSPHTYYLKAFSPFLFVGQFWERLPSSGSITHCRGQGFCVPFSPALPQFIQKLSEEKHLLLAPILAGTGLERKL